MNMADDRARRFAGQLGRGDRIMAGNNHHVGMRVLKYGERRAPKGEHLNRLCDARACSDVYVGYRLIAKGRRVPTLLCTNPNHYESGPPDGGSEMRYMRETGRAGMHPGMHPLPESLEALR